MTALSLTPAQRKAQRAKAHALNPVVMIGNDGLTAAVRKEIDLALSSHGLIKIRILGDDRDARIARAEARADGIDIGLGKAGQGETISDKARHNGGIHDIGGAIGAEQIGAFIAETRAGFSPQAQDAQSIVAVSSLIVTPS